MTPTQTALARAVRQHPPGPDQPGHPAAAAIRSAGEALSAEGGLDAMHDALRAIDPDRTGEPGRRVNRLWQGIGGWQG